MPKRRLRYAAAVDGILEKVNTKHIFAQKHAMNIYAPGAIYSLIPKNACSTLRLSISIENGCLKEASQAMWIVPNTYAFSASLADLLRARYTFIILRCPYARLASCFLDKLTHATVPAKKYLRAQPAGMSRLMLKSAKRRHRLSTYAAFVVWARWLFTEAVLAIRAASALRRMGSCL